jgi:hypothetical protein
MATCRIGRVWVADGDAALDGCLLGDEAAAADGWLRTGDGMVGEEMERNKMVEASVKAFLKKGANRNRPPKNAKTNFDGPIWQPNLAV